MRSAAEYSLRVEAPLLQEGDDVFTQSHRTVEEWLEDKGQLASSEDGHFVLMLADGRNAALQCDDTKFANGRLMEWTLTEPAGPGTFATSISLARVGAAVGVHCSVRVGTSAFRPVPFDARCPNIIGALLDLRVGWRLGRSLLPDRPLRFRDTQGAEDLSHLIMDATRDVPVVVVSELEGFFLHPRLDIDLHRDLRGLAITTSINSQAAWALTTKHGREWSCFNGAVRVYWPGADPAQDPRSHPLWTADALLDAGGSHRDAASEIRARLRQRILGLSTLSIASPPEVVEARRAKRSQLAAAARESVNPGEWVQMLEDRNAELETEVTQAREELVRLRIDNANFQARLEIDEEPGAAQSLSATEKSSPPQTVAEAVEIARKRYAGELLFGGDVSDGVASIADGAGPPEKILRFLGGLSQLALAMRAGPLGAQPANWLSERNFPTTDETAMTKNNARDMQRRTWDAGGAREGFTLHMKPKDGTSPDQCVRIYFLWDDERRQIIVGQVGRHP